MDGKPRQLRMSVFHENRHDLLTDLCIHLDNCFGISKDERKNMNKYASFDLEIAEEFDPDGNWNENYGITCAAVARTERPVMFYYLEAPRISKQFACRLVADLQDFEAEGYKVVTWNGTGFDFRVLADASGMRKECAELAMNHIDMMLLVTFQKGYYLGLDKALKGMSIKGKLHEVTLKDGSVITDMSGAIAPELWAAGEYEAVLTYLKDDVTQPLELAHRIDEEGFIHWRSNAGNHQMVQVPRLYTVKECLDLPEPDTSWMTHPPRREQFVEWME